MKFIAIDLEADQPSGEVIQIGAAVFDTQTKTPEVPVNTFSEYLETQSHSKPNWDYKLDSGQTLEELLGWDFPKRHAQLALPAEKGFTQFWDWVNYVQAGKKFIQWGSMDMNLITAQCKENFITWPRFNVIDLKQLYKYFLVPAWGLPKQAGLAKAMESLGISSEGRAHDAYFDALHTGLIALKVFNALETQRKIKEMVK